MDGRTFYQYRDGLCLFAIDCETGLAVAVAGSSDKLALELKRVIATNHWGTYMAALRRTMEECDLGPRPGVVLKKQHQQ